MKTELPQLTDRQAQVLHFIQTTIDTLGYPPTVREIGEHLGIRSTNGVADHLKALKRKGYLTQQDMKSRTLKPTTPAGPPGERDTTLGQEQESTRPIGGAPGAPSTNYGQEYGHGYSGPPTREAARPIAQPASGRQVPPSYAGPHHETSNVVPLILPQSGEAVRIPILGRVAAGEPILAEEDAEGAVVVDSMLVGNGRRLFALKVVGESMIDDGIHDGDYIFVQKRSHADAGAIVVVMIDNEATVKRFYPEGQRVRLQPANASMQPIYINRSDFRDTQIIGVVVGVYRRV